MGIIPLLGAGVPTVAFDPTTGLSNKIAWLDASLITTLWTDSARTTQVAANSDPVGAWDDRTGSGNFTQATSSKRAAYKTNIQNGLPGVLFDNIDDVLSFSRTQSAGDYTLFIAMNWVTVAGADSGHILDFQTGRLAIGQFNAALGWYDGGWRTISSLSTGAVLITYKMVNGAAKIYKNNVDLGAGLTYTQQALGGTQILGESEATPGANKLNAYIFEMILCTGDQSASQSNMDTYLNNKWAIH